MDPALEDPTLTALRETTMILMDPPRKTQPPTAPREMTMMTLMAQARKIQPPTALRETTMILMGQARKTTLQATPSRIPMVLSALPATTITGQAM